MGSMAAKIVNMRQKIQLQQQQQHPLPASQQHIPIQLLLDQPAPMAVNINAVNSTVQQVEVQKELKRNTQA